jgi:two-component system response regulator HydG
VAVDVRVVAATHRDLTAAIEEGRFREDLYYRLNVVEVQLPPLRERGGDILLLAQHFLLAHAARMKREVTGIQPAAAEKLLAYNWPGNVRELSNCMERAVALALHDQISVADLPERIRDHQARRTVVELDDTSTILPLDEIERRYILRVLEACGGHKQKAASLLKIDRKTLYRKLVEYGMSSEQANR